jgi:DtxR family Mn-dependent transcriptional regulator
MPGRHTTTSHVVEEYLEAIHKFGRTPDGVSTTRLAEHLQVTPASVTGMLRRLTRDGLISYHRYGDIALTAEGDRRAHEMIKRHRLAERLLTDMLKVPLDAAHEEACRLEHALSPEVEARLETALGSPESCPHGNPIDAGAEDRTFSLAEAPVGRTLTISRMDDETPEVVRYLSERKLLPGAPVTVKKREALGTVLVVEVGGKRHHLSATLAESIRVTRWEETA